MWGLSAVGTLVAASFALSFHASFDPAQLTVSAITYDRFAVIVKAVALLGGAIVVLIGWDEVGDKEAADYYGCLLILLAGVCLTGAANDLVTLFLALEMISIPTYVILYLQRTDLAAQESAAKYFLLSIFAAALVLFGFSYLYGLTGSTNLTAILNALAQAAVGDKPELSNTPLLALVALVMIVAGIGFKITAVPFHFYAPDVYQGTTPSVAGLLAFAPKVAGFAALLRVLGFLYYDPVMRPGLGLGQQAPVLFWILAAMTMTVGNVLALLQDNLKRMLAYSSVAHAGYMLIGLAVAPSLFDPQRPTPTPTSGGVEAVLFYLIAYSAMTLGPFGVIAYLSTKERPVETIDDLAGVSVSHPAVALLMALFMFSLIGIPLTAGFAGKMLLFMGALTAPTEGLTPSMASLFR
jgi:NADH-quinone oxidoreductase subunit N